MASATAALADPIDPCSLLTSIEMEELGIPKGATPSRELQPGGVQACRYEGVSTGSTVSVIISQGVPDRARQLRAMQGLAQREGTAEQLSARGEYFQGNVMCKVVVTSETEKSQCLGATEQSVIGLSVSRAGESKQVTSPALQLRIIGTLVSRVASSGG